MAEHKIFFDNGRGFRLCGILEDCGTGKSAPIAILAHGFATNKNRPKYLSLAYELKEIGIASFRFDFFAHGESEGDFEDITISEGANDIIRAIGVVISKGYSSIGLLGVSFGGICSLIAAPKTDKLKALVLVSPVSDYAEKRISELGENGIAEWKKTGFMDYKDFMGKIKGRIRYGFLKIPKTI